MNCSDWVKGLSATVFALLAGCAVQPPDADAIFAIYPDLYPYGGPAPLTAGGASNPNSWLESVDAYKSEVAEHIMRYNVTHTFSGHLPPMLPAIVVLTITVDKDGRMKRVAVQRSRDDDASEVAVASMYRSGILPKPYKNLVLGRDRTVTFSETFLFNDDYRFQLRTLAGVQELR